MMSPEHRLIFVGLSALLILFDEAEIRRALAICEISVTKLSIYWADRFGRERDRSYIEQQLTDQRPLHHRDLGRLPLRWAQWYFFLMSRKVGLPHELLGVGEHQAALMTYERQLGLFEE